MQQKEPSTRKQKLLDRRKKLNAELAKIERKEKKETRKFQDHHKFMMGGAIVKYFPEAYDFTEQEMNRIIACAFKCRDVQNMIRTVIKERPEEDEYSSEEEDEIEDLEDEEIETDDPSKIGGGVGD